MHRPWRTADARQAPLKCRCRRFGPLRNYEFVFGNFQGTVWWKCGNIHYLCVCVCVCVRACVRARALIPPFMSAAPVVSADVQIFARIFKLMDFISRGY
jgi:hypothetical protein